jgi:hypothetical protein
MDEKEVKKSKGIGVTNKDANPTSAGFRGIGIWAGFQACDRLELITTKLGVANRFKLTIDFADIRKHVKENINIKQLLDGRYHIEKEDAGADEHYTHVKLIGLHGEHLKLADEGELKRITSHILPCRINPQFKHAQSVQEYLEQNVDGYREFPLFVGNAEVFREFPAEVEQPQFFSLSENGEDYGYVWWCSANESIKVTPPEYRSFQLRIKNIGVGRDGIFDDEDGAGFGIVNKLKLTSPAHLNWHVGEIHLTHEKIVPDTPRSSLELSTLSRRAIEAVRGFYEDRIAESRARSTLNTYRQRIRTAEELLKKASPDVDKAAEVYSYLKAQELLTRGPKPKDPVKRKIREYLAKSAEKTRRKHLLKDLEKIPGISLKKQAASKKSSNGQKKEQPSKDAANPDKGNNDSGTACNGEALLSDLCNALQELLGDEPELYTKACASIGQVLRKYGVIHA